MSVPLRARFPGLDGLRAVGALLVLTTHVGFHSGAAVTGPVAGPLSRMDFGVALFFVISGFLLFRPHVVHWMGIREHEPTRRYLWHRALRILPPLWLAVLGAALLVPDSDATVRDYLWHALLVQIYVPGHTVAGLTQMWSLATEAAFYLALPLLGWALCRRGPQAPDTQAVLVRLGILLATPLLGAGWMALNAGQASQRPLWLPGFLGWFGLGMALALWQVARSRGLLGAGLLDELVTHPWTCWCLALALFLLVSTPVAGPFDLSATTAGAAGVKSFSYAVMGTLVVLPAVGRLAPPDHPAVRSLGGRVGKTLGDLSYGVFCYHLIVLSLVERITGHEIFQGGFWTLWFPTVVGSFLLAAASFYGVERPVMRRGRRTDRRPAAGGAAATATATTASS